MAWDVTNKAMKSIVDSSIYSQITNFVVEVEAELLEPFIGTVPKDKGVYAEYIMKKMETKFVVTSEPGEEVNGPDTSKIKELVEEDRQAAMEEIADEVNTVPDEEDSTPSTTGFHIDDEGVFFYNYMIVGNIKANLKILKDSGAVTLKAFNKASDTCIEIEPRKVRFYTTTAPDDEVKDCYKEDKKLYSIISAPYTFKRPLRASTAKGERTTIVTSEIVPAGTRFKFTTKLLKNTMGVTPENLVRAFKVGEIHGLGQWRGSGSFGKYKIVNIKKLKSLDLTPEPPEGQ